MFKPARFAFTSPVLILLVTMAPAVWSQSGTHLREIVSSIAQGADSAERRRAIIAQLEAAGIAYELQDFQDARMRKGVNITVVTQEKNPKTILLGAHYDRVPVGQGAVDNGSSCAVLIDLLSRFKAKPPANYGLTVVFFDLEEVGLSGSQAYFASRGNTQLPAYAINLDIFGYGDSIFATASNPDGTLASALHKAAAATKFPIRLSSPAQYPASDHRSMIAAGIETLGIALTDAGEIDGVLALLARRSTDVPPILTIIHTPKDTVDAARPDDVEKAIPVLEQMIRLVDDKP